MEVDKDEMARTFSDLTDEELLRRHASGELTDIGYSILERELTGRGINIPRRPLETEIPIGRPHSLRAHWEGKASLASAYWFLWVIGSNVLGFVLGLLSTFVDIQRAHFISVILLSVFAAYVVFAGISVWRCAWNTSWKGWGYIARATVAALPLGLLVSLIIIFTNRIS